LENKKAKSGVTGQVRKELRELTSSISKMMGVFREIRKPIQESFEKVPTTTQHLEKVTEQTEQATHRVLDMVEDISNRETDNAECIKKIKELIPENILSSNDELGELLKKVFESSEASLNDSYSIMDALQFQDITSQQMDHAITLLDDVEDKLMSLLSAVGAKNGKLHGKDGKKKRVYDPNAKFTVDGAQQQDEIDSIISNLE